MILIFNELIGLKWSRLNNEHIIKIDKTIVKINIGFKQFTIMFIN